MIYIMSDVNGLEPKVCIIYIIRNSVNSKVYVGQTWSSLPERFAAHIKNAKAKKKRGSVKIQNAMRKHGYDNFTIEKLDEAFDQKRADELEDYYILTNNSIAAGYNLKGGGASGKHSLEARKKMSLAKMGKKNRLYGKTGIDSPFYGIPHSNERKLKTWEKTTGRLS